MSEIKSNKMLAKLGVMYGPPSRDPKESIALIGEYARLMAQYSDSELEAAGDKLVRTRKFKTWPTVGECIEVLEDNRTAAYERSAPERTIEQSYPEWSPAAIAHANKRVIGTLGRKAAQEGWCLGLHRFYAEEFAKGYKTSEPSNKQIASMMDAAKFVDRCVAGEVNLGVADREARSWADGILVKRKNVADLALHGVVS